MIKRLKARLLTRIKILIDPAEFYRTSSYLEFYFITDNSNDKPISS